MTWTEPTWAKNRDHRCEPADPGVGSIAFFGCRHCGQIWNRLHRSNGSEVWVWDGGPSAMDDAELIARRFHEIYEELAPTVGYETREASRKPWTDVPEQNKRLMIAVVTRLLAEDVI